MTKKIDPDSTRRFPLTHLENDEWEFVKKIDPEFTNLYFNLRKHVSGDSDILPRKYKELIHVCFLCQQGAPDLTLLAHLRRAKGEGATTREIVEALESAMIAAGVPTFFNGVIALMKLEREESASST